MKLRHVLAASCVLTFCGALAPGQEAQLPPNGTNGSGLGTPVQNPRPPAPPPSVDDESTVVVENPADINGDGRVNSDDLFILLMNWGSHEKGKPSPADIAPPGGNSMVNMEDLLVLLASWDAKTPSSSVPTARQ
jgi:hypothetical protein